MDIKQQILDGIAELARKNADVSAYLLGLQDVADMVEQLPDAGLDEWCTECKEYDHEKHCCPRYNRVIRETLAEVKPWGQEEEG